MTTEAKATEKPVITPVVRELADKFKAKAVVDHKAGTIVPDANFYVEMLPDGHTEKSVKELRAHDIRMAAALTLANGEIAQEIAKKNKSLEDITTVLPMTGKDKMTTTWTKTRQYVDNTKPKDETTGLRPTATSYGFTTTEIEIFGSKKSGDMKKVRDHLSEMALAAFGS